MLFKSPFCRDFLKTQNKALLMHFKEDGIKHRDQPFCVKFLYAGLYVSQQMSRSLC